jgi:hypothetical protein
MSNSFDNAPCQRERKEKLYRVFTQAVVTQLQANVALLAWQRKASDEKKPQAFLLGVFLL